MHGSIVSRFRGIELPDDTLRKSEYRVNGKAKNLLAPLNEHGAEMAGVSVVAKRLKEARLRAGISQKQLGIRAGIDEFSASARINQYERGKHMPDLQTLTRLADLLGLPVPYFYCQDSDLAEVIAGFSRLSRSQRKKLLGLLGGL